MPTRLPPRRADGRFKRGKRRRNPAGTEILLAFARPAAAAVATEFGKEFYERSKKTVKKAARKGKKRR